MMNNYKVCSRQGCAYLKYAVVIAISILLIASYTLLIETAIAEDTQESSLAGSFYPKEPSLLKATVDNFIDNAAPESIAGDIIALVI